MESHSLPILKKYAPSISDSVDLSPNFIITLIDLRAKIASTTYWHEQSALQSVAVRRLTGNNVCGPLLARAVVRSSQSPLPGQLATIIVDRFFHCYWHERSALQSVAVQAVDWQRR